MRNSTTEAITMTHKATKAGVRRRELDKTQTGIKGLDDITYGGLPKGRPTLVCG